MSPVWIMNAGFCVSALTLAMASSSVPSAFGLAGLSKPTWLSLICRKLKPFGADPGHAFQHFAPIDAVVAIEFAHCPSPVMPKRVNAMWLPGT
jgi:hypothetical protein